MGQGASVDVESHKITLHVIDVEGVEHEETFNIDFKMDDLTVGGVLAKLMENDTFMEMVHHFYNVNARSVDDLADIPVSHNGKKVRLGKLVKKNVECLMNESGNTTLCLTGARCH